MSYEGYTTFRTQLNDAILTVTFDFPPVKSFSNPVQQPRPLAERLVQPTQAL